MGKYIYISVGKDFVNEKYKYQNTKENMNTSIILKIKSF